MAKKSKRNPNLRAATVARVNQLVKEGQTKAGAFEKISSETGRAKDAVQMLYYRAMRAAKAGPKSASKSEAKATSRKAAPKTAAGRAARKAATVSAPKRASRPRRRSRKASRSAARPRSQAQGGALGNDFPTLLNGIASAINALLKHVEKTVEENKTLREQSDRLKAISSLIRGR